MFRFLFILFFLSLFFFSCKKEQLYNLNNDRFSNNTNLYTPFWIFGFHIWEDNKNNSDAVRYIINNYTKNQIAISSVIFDSPWSLSYNDFIIDTNRYNDYRILFDELENKNLKKIFWLTGFQNINSSDARNSKSSLFDFFRINDMYVNNGAVYKWWKGEGAHINFYNNFSNKYFLNLLNNFKYASGWKLDEGYSFLPSKIEISKDDSVNNISFGNKYYNVITNSQNELKRVTIGRAYSSQGNNPRLHSLPENVTFAWSGDHRGDSQGISEQLYDIYESINSKHNLLLWEVGGYNFPAPNKYELINSVKIGALLPMMSNGGRNGGLTNHLPWFHDKETTIIFKKFVDLHYNLMPFFYSETLKYGKNFLLKINPESNNSYYISNTLVVFNNYYSKDIYKCNFDTNYQWVNILNDEIIKSNYINFESTPNNISTYIKNGSIIPFYNFYQNSDTISFKIYPNKSNSNVFILPLNFEDKNCKVIIKYSTKDGYLNTSSNCGKILKINIKSNVEPKISKLSTNWYYDNNSKWVTIITDKENLITKIENFKDYN